MAVNNLWKFPTLSDNPNVVTLVVLSTRQCAVSSWGTPEAQILAADEKERLLRIKHDQTRQQYWLARVALRQWLAQITHVHPADIQFAKNRYDRPYLVSPSFAALDFNISHCDEWVAIAITQTPTEQSHSAAPVAAGLGVDIEHQARNTDTSSLAERFFHSEETAFIQSLPEGQQQDAFFSIWTAKEAYVKALGTGLQTALDSFVVEPLTINNREPQALTHAFGRIRGGQGVIRLSASQREATQVHYWQLGERLHLSCVQLHHTETKIDVWLWENHEWRLIGG